MACAAVPRRVAPVSWEPHAAPRDGPGGAEQEVSDTSRTFLLFTFGFLSLLPSTTSTCGTSDVVVHAISWVKKKGYNPSEVCCIYPTSPLLQIKDLKNSLKDLKTGKWQYIFSATTFGPSIYRSFIKDKKKKLKSIFSNKINKRSQDLEQAYHDAGQFYWATASTWLSKKEIFGKKSKITLLPRWRVQDIDVIDDWKKAEIIFRLL